MKVIWTQKALFRLEEIEDYIATDSLTRAIDFVSNLMNQADTLAKFPKSGRPVPETKDEEQPLYRVKGTSVFILSVFEGSRLIRVGDLS